MGVELARFEEFLAQEPEELTPIDRDQLELRRVLGVA